METVMSAPPETEVSQAEPAPIHLSRPALGVIAAVFCGYLCVIGQIWPEGLGLMLQGVGLSGLTAFASLYFAARGWGHARFVMTAFGSGYIFVRLVLGHLPDKIGGYRVALCSLAIKAIGQALIWRASHELLALGGTLVTGFGRALERPVAHSIKGPRA
jgi:MFS family permease